MKILLVGIYDTNTVSLAPQLLSAYVKQFPIAGKYEIQTREFSIFSDTAESIIEEIQNYHPDIVGFSCYIWNYNLIREITPHLDCTILLGGPQVTGIEQKILQTNPEIDVIVTGEGERSFAALLEYFAGERSLDGIPGISTALIQNPPLEPTCLESVPPLYAGIFTQYPDLTW